MNHGVTALVLLAALHACAIPEAAAQSARPGWGSTPYADAAGTGVTFRTWAPAATSVSVAGSFNGWNGTANPLVLESAVTGVWSLDVPAARTNDNYKYVINGSLWRSDPRGRIINALDNNNSVITRTNAFNWSGDSAAITNASDLVIYEAHVGVFTGPGGTFNSFTNRLDYLRDLGISAIELMPVNEFPSATSWGYNPAYPFALETDYGAPDTFKQMVQSAHQRGLVTLLDVVHNHWDGGSSLWQFDGTTPGPYFYATDPYAYTPWGPRPEYSQAAVREYINDSLRMWLDEYHLSGFRWDAPKHIIYTTNDQFIADGLTMVTNALRMMATNYPGTWNIAEDTKEISGFNYFWDLTFNWEIKSVLTQSDDNLRDMPTVARNVGGIPGRIIFTDSHDTAGDLNGGVRLPVAIHSGDPAGYYARKRSALGAVLVMTSPGTPMILQGQELLETNQFSDTRGMDWTRTNSQAGTLRLYRDLIRLRRNLDGVSAGLLGDTVSTYLVDNVNKLMAYSRSDSIHTGDTVVVVANFANTTRSSYAVQLPEAGTWYTLFNSDATNYAGDYGNAGSAEVVATGDPPTGSVTIAPYSALILSRTPRSGLLVLNDEVLDQPAGNGDGVLDPGETIRARIVLWNKSQIAATNVSAQLLSDTPGLSIVQGSSSYPSMPPEGTATNALLFEYQIAPSQACGSLLDLRLVTSFNGQTVTARLEHLVGQTVQIPPTTNLFVSTDTPVFIPDTSTVYSLLDIEAPGSNLLSDVNVRVRINHTYDRDLTLALQHPDGTEVLLVRRRGGSSNNFGTGTGACENLVYTIFDQDASQSITSGVAPFAATFRPEATLATFNGKPLNGTWRLRMRDETTRDVGTNLCWAILATYEQRVVDCNAFLNQAPAVTGATHLLVHNTTTNFFLPGGDPDGQAIDFQPLSAPAHGQLELLNPSNGWSRYQPIHGFSGTDTFDFAASDGLATSTPAAITIIVTPPIDTDTNGLPDAWEQTYFTNLLTALPEGDDDGDGMDNRAEYLAQTNPQDSNSVLRLTQLQTTSAWYTLEWSSVGGTRYTLEYGPRLDPDQFQPVPRTLAEEIDPAPYGEASSRSFVDDFTLTAPPGTNALRLYRVRVQNN